MAQRPVPGVALLGPVEGDAGDARVREPVENELGPFLERLPLVGHAFPPRWLRLLWRGGPRAVKRAGGRRPSRVDFGSAVHGLAQAPHGGLMGHNATSMHIVKPAFDPLNDR